MLQLRHLNPRLSRCRSGHLRGAGSCRGLRAQSTCCLAADRTEGAAAGAADPLLRICVRCSECFASLKACELDVQNAALKVHAIRETSLQSSALAWIHGRVQVVAEELMEDLAARLSQYGDRSGAASCTVQPSCAQRRIIEYPHSLFLQGRSGTGKTVCIIHRILRARHQFPFAQRLFVTRSSLLCAQARSLRTLLPYPVAPCCCTSPQVLEQLAVFGSASRDAALLHGSSGGTPVCTWPASLPCGLTGTCLRSLLGRHPKPGCKNAGKPTKNKKY